MKRRVAGLLLLAGLATASAQTRAQDVALTGTLKTVLDRGVLRLGLRDNAIPFAFHNRAGQLVGFSFDLCMGIAADIAQALNLDLLDTAAPAWRKGLRVVTVPITPDARLPKVINGDIDLECGSTTATAERAKTVAFSPVFFLAGTKLLVPPSSKVATYRDLVGKAVAVSAGTTNSDVMHQLARRGTPSFTVTETPDVLAAFGMLVDGRAAAFASDDILLAGFVATKPSASSFRIVGDYLSYEPYAIMFRKDDPALAALVTTSFQRMAAAGTLRTLYNRWFTDELPNGEMLNLPMSPHLSEMFRALGEPD